MKVKLFLLFVAMIMIILFAGVTLKSSSNGATGIAVINQACADNGGFCTDAGLKEVMSGVMRLHREVCATQAGNKQYENILHAINYTDVRV